MSIGIGAWILVSGGGGVIVVGASLFRVVVMIPDVVSVLLEMPPLRAASLLTAAHRLRSCSEVSKSGGQSEGLICGF